MKSYPVRVNRSYYRGADKKKRNKTVRYNQIAAKVEAYLNDDLASCPDDAVRTSLIYEIADAIHEDSDVVHRIVFATDGGSNGITIVKGDFDRAMAKRC